MPGGYSKSFWICAFENSHGKMKAGNLHSSDRLSKARGNDHESVWKHQSVAAQPPVVRLLSIDEPTGRTLRADHVDLDIRIPGKSECAPYNEGAPEIEDWVLPDQHNCLTLPISEAKRGETAGQKHDAENGKHREIACCLRKRILHGGLGHLSGRHLGNDDLFFNQFFTHGLRRGGFRLLCRSELLWSRERL